MSEKVEQRSYHGNLSPDDMARALVMRFDEGDTRAQWMRDAEKRAVVQVRSRKAEHGDPNTAVTVHITPSETGVVVSVSEQKWLGVAADLARTGVKGWLNPMRLLNEIDDIARNVRWLGMRSEIWKAVEEYCQSRGSGRGTAALLKNVVCSYCGTPNDIGAHNCNACKAPLTAEQPIVCPQCGFLNNPEASLCVNCGGRLRN